MQIPALSGNLYRKFGFFGGNLRSDPPKPGGDFENPEGNPPGPRAGAEAGERREAPNGGRSGGPRARRAARGDFQNPRTGDGDLGESPIKNQNFVHIFFMYITLT